MTKDTYFSKKPTFVAAKLSKMQTKTSINIEDYNYPLPEERIAAYPQSRRDSSKLLIWDNGRIHNDSFSHITDHLPSNSLIIFNKTKVIQARMIFHKETGAAIEIFCLHPLSPSNMEDALSANSSVEWNCLVGNAKKWKSGELKKHLFINNSHCDLRISKEEQLKNSFRIQFTWNNDNISFGDILDHFGQTPLPPYIKRDSTPEDKERYQCVYAELEGSVAAPTAGLHYTQAILNSLAAKNINTEELTLHVGAGTFHPVKEADVSKHIMHTEKIIFSKHTIQNIYNAVQQKQNIIAVGTTSMRSLESLYWHGVKIIHNTASENIDIKQWEAMELPQDIPLNQSLEAILHKYQHSQHISGQTQLIITPGYSIRLVDVLNTNFHQPKSTLLLLVAAFIGEDWKKVYQHALDNQYRFLSYGDSCLFYKKK